MKLHRLFIITLSFILTLSITAQEMKIFSSDGYLSSCLVNKIYQDSKGFVWIATEYGLNRFDGTRFVTYKNVPGDSTSLCDNYVRTLTETRDGKILVGTLKGLMEWDRARESFSYIPIYVKGTRITPHVSEIIELSNGDIWVGTAGYGIFLYKPDSSAITRLDMLSDAVGSEFISCIYEDSSHAVWIGTENHGACRYYPAGGKARCFSAPELAGDKVTSILEGNAGAIFIGSLDGGVDRYDKGSSTVSHLSCQGERLSVKSLAAYDKEFYAGTEGYGVRQLSDTEIKDVPVGSALSGCTDGKIHQMMTDRDGNLWLAMFQRGVAMIAGRRFNFEYCGRNNPGNPIGNGCVMAVFSDENHHLWVSCDNDGLYELDENFSRVRHIPSSSTVLCMLRDSRRRRWAATFNSGLVRIDDSGRMIPVSRFSSLKIYSIVEDKAGNLYLGTLGCGLIRYNPEKDTASYLSFNRSQALYSNIPMDWINHLYPAADGKIWIAHYDGISCFNTATGGYLSFGDSYNVVKGCIGYVVTRDSKGNIWCGTSDGLYRFDSDGRSVKHFSIADGLPNNVVCGICEDEGGNLWISTYHGIAKYISADNRFVNFDSGDGLQGNEFTHGAFCEDSRGVIYFGGTNGVTAFHPYDINDNPREYHPVITRFDIFNTPVNRSTLSSGGTPIIDCELGDAERVNLSADDNTFTIYFSTLTYDNPDKLVYQYRIYEHGKEWLTTAPGQNQLTFNNMPPGEYRFQVRVAGDTSEAGTRTLTIVVNAPWYQSWWAILIYIVLAALMVLGAVHYFRSRAAGIREQLDRQQAEQIIEAKLQFFTNISHEIRTPMTLIINPLEKLIADTSDSRLRATYNMIYHNAKRILRLVNQLMDMRKLEKGQMKVKMRETDMVEFISEAMLPFEYVARENDIALRFHHHMDALAAWIDTDNFDKVLLNILSNAFKYTPKGGSIDITLTEKHDDPAGLPPFSDYVEISISDTGIGIDADKLELIFDRFYRIENEMTSASLGTGIGLHLCRSLVLLHHGTIHARNHVGESGCEFIIRLPLGSAHLSMEEIADSDPTPSQRQLPYYLDDFNDPGTDGDSTVVKARSNRTVAVVEDDPDIRNYLVRELSGDYKVSAYDNGDEALSAILTDTPDLIVSDVMMPGINGYTLCRKVKQNVNINHTPVILLSAKADNEDRMEGLAAGADAYLTKPFSTEVLRSTITSLLANRQLLRAKFSGVQEQEESVKQIMMKSQDEILLTRIMDVINANISSPDFSVEKLAAEVGLSRVHLHRKLKELTDLSARDFIKSLRMKQAARLLREKKLSVAEVAYATGFANPSHFSSAFKEIYGMTPSQYSSRERG